MGFPLVVLTADMLVVIIGPEALCTDKNNSEAHCGDSAAHQPRSAALTLAPWQIACLCVVDGIRSTLTATNRPRRWT